MSEKNTINNNPIDYDQITLHKVDCKNVLMGNKGYLLRSQIATAKSHCFQ